MLKYKKYVKLALDILIGAVAPVVILKYGTAYLGTLPAYLTAALVPVAWVLLDLFVITRRFNFITTYGGLGAFMRGALAFWYVDGALFAFKDSASYLLALIVFGGTLVVGKPVTRAIALQGFVPDTPERVKSLERLLDEPSVTRALRQATLAIAFTNLAAGAVNYWINLRMVVAPFGTPTFNDQVANVNAITRVALVLPDMLALFWAFSLMYKAMYALLPEDIAAHPAKDAATATVDNAVAVNAPIDAPKASNEEANAKRGAQETDFWELLERREALLAAGTSEADIHGSDVLARANQQARSEFGITK